MKSALEEETRLNIRRVRSQQITHLIFHALRDFIPDDCQGRAMDALYRLLHDAGAEVVTDQTRAEAGLPPRGPDGWTVEELLALERRRLEIMTRPIMPIFVERK
jgi:hypothetical protein